MSFTTATSTLLLLVLVAALVAAKHSNPSRRHSASKRQEDDAGVDAVLRVECPQLAAQATLDAICGDARKGFSFSDGCNRVRCMPFGAAKSRRGCPPASPSHSASCRRLADSVFSSLPSRTCPNAAPSQICPAVAGSLEQYGRGLPFTDGCNRFGCREDGSGGAMTRRRCPQGEEDSAYCRYFAESQLVPDAGSSAGQRRRKRPSSNQQADTSAQEFACPSLAIEQVCGPATMGFSYSDGCNHVTCHRDGTGQTSTFKACPAPMGEAGQAYCAQAESQMRAKMARAKLRNRCLEPEQVCKDRRRIAYFNGCNRCFCTGVGESACTRRGCPSLLLTDEEFAEHCEKSGAGVL